MGNPRPRTTPTPPLSARDKRFEIHRVIRENNVVMAEAAKNEKIGLLLALAAQAAGIVWWASSLNSQVSHNDFQIQMMAKDVEENTIFTRDWPAGKWGSGSLPDDVRQNLKLESLEKQVEKLTEDLYKSKIANGHD